MIIRVILAVFISGATGICYLAGFARLMSGLLIGFGSLVCIFFGIIFIVPEENRQLWFPVFGDGLAWPFFLLALILAGLAGLLFIKRSEEIAPETVSSVHFQYFIGAFFAYVLSVFLPSLLWFPSEEKRTLLDAETLGF